MKLNETFLCFFLLYFQLDLCWLTDRMNFCAFIFNVKGVKELENKNTVTYSEMTANPAPLGLMGFGMTTILLNILRQVLYIISLPVARSGVNKNLDSITFICSHEKKKRTGSSIRYAFAT